MATANFSRDELSFSSRLNVYLILVVKSIYSNFLEEFESFNGINSHMDVFLCVSGSGSTRLLRSSRCLQLQSILD